VHVHVPLNDQIYWLLLREVKIVIVDVKDVFATEELRTDVTSSQYRRLEKSFMAIDMRNAVFEWPYRAQAVDSIDQKEQEHSKWQHKLKNREQSGE